MRIRSLLLAGAVLPFAAGTSAFALDAASLAPTSWVLAQNEDEEECPEDQECPPPELAPEEVPPEGVVPEEVPPEEVLEDAPPVEEVIPEEVLEDAPTVEKVIPDEVLEDAPAVEEVIPEEVLEDAPAVEEVIPQEVIEETPLEVPDEAETLQAVPDEAVPPADDVPEATTAEEPAIPADVLRRARRQQERRQQDEADDETVEPLETEEAAEPVEEAPAAAETVPLEDDSETEAVQELQTPAEPELVQPEGEPTPDDVLRRAQRQQERLQRQEDRQQRRLDREQAEQPIDEAPTGAEEQPADVAAPEQPTAPPPPAPSVVEQQLEATGEGEQVNRIRALRRKLQEETAAAGAAAAPEEEVEEEAGGRRRRGDDDADQAEADEEDDGPGIFRWLRRDRDDDQDEDRVGERRRDRIGDRRGNRGRGRGEVVEDRGDRIIIDLGGGNIYVEPVVPDEGERLLYGARDVEVEELRNGRTRTIVYRENGSQIVTIRDRRGNIIRRTRITPNGREVVLIDNRYEDDDLELPPVIIYEQADLPPLVVNIPEERYIVDLGRATEVEIEAALLAPPVQEIEQQFTLEEVTRNERVRAYVPRIDLDTITFDFGSATISESQIPALAELGQAMEDVISENPDEVYLVEGHTDAVGSDYDNLILSDRRAEAVAVALSQNFDIPPENLVTEGYGEQYLKVPTPGPERENRRVTVRRITPLLQAEAQ